jgi:NAD(P)H dehydrogenase (quinone)
LRPTLSFSGSIGLTGPRSTDLYGLAEDYAAPLGRAVRYVEVPLDIWSDDGLRKRALPDHVYAHFLTVAKLHAAGRHDRFTNSVEEILGRPATSLKTTLEKERDRFKAVRPPSDAASSSSPTAL